MTTPVITVPPDAPFAQLVHLMLTHEISSLPVADEDGRLAGIVTEADLVPKEAYGHGRRRALGILNDFLHGHDLHWTHKATGRTAGDLMTADPVTVSPDDDLIIAAQRMVSSSCKHMPVVDNTEVVGILSRRDVLRLFQRSDASIFAVVAERLADPSLVSETHQATAKVVNGVVTLHGTVLSPSDATALESAMAQIDGVVGVDNKLTAREPGHTPAELAPSQRPLERLPGRQQRVEVERDPDGGG